MSRIYRVGDIVVFNPANGIPDWVPLLGYPFRVVGSTGIFVDIEPVGPLPPHTLSNFKGFYHHRFIPYSRLLYRRHST